MTDVTIYNAKLAHRNDLVNIHTKDGVICAIDSVESDQNSQNITKNSYDARGHLVCGGFYESHIHLDKACILDRCNIKQGDLQEAVSETGAAKKGFSEHDVYERASRVIEMAIKKGTVGLRTFVETDEKTELRSFHAIKKARDDYAFAIDIEICVFAQEGFTQAPTTQTLMREALAQGADVVGGCPYKDNNPDRHIEMIFDLAQDFDVDVDFHLDFDIDPNGSSIPKLVTETIKRGYQGRVSIGYVTKLSAMDQARRRYLIDLLKSAGVTLTVLPATDIFLTSTMSK